MTLDECCANIGAGVVYKAACGCGEPEDGVITSVGNLYAFVRYRGDNHSKATHPDHLTLLSKGAV